MKVIEKIIDNYFDNEKTWTEIINKYYPNPTVFYKWHRHHRVILTENRIVKIQYLGEDSEIPISQTIKNEFLIYECISDKINNYKAKLINLKKGWFALEINYFKGYLIEELMIRNLNLKKFVIPLLIKVFKLSMCGIYHNQLRSRHFIVSQNNEICIIDYGNSKKMSKIDALINNFGFLDIKNSKFLYLLKQLLFFKKVIRNENYISKNMFNRDFEFLDVKSTNGMVYKKKKIYSYINKLLTNKLSENQDLYKFVPSFYLEDFHCKGAWQWEPVRRVLFEKINFTHSKTLLIGAGIGLFPLFAGKLNNNILAFENNKTLKTIANSILRLSSNYNKIENEPKNLLSIINNFDYIICFDFNCNKNLSKIIPRKKQFKKFIYITKIDPEKLKVKYNNLLNFFMLKKTDLYIYEIN